jgi:hypothetical protein
VTEPPNTDHARSCGECGASLDERQEICVECGHSAGPRDRRRIRRALPTASLAAFAVLLAASAAYGLSAGDAGNVRDLGVGSAKPAAPDTVASATPTLPQASGTTTPATPVPPATATPAPTPSPTPSKPKATAAKPKPATTTPATTTPSTGSTGGTNSSSGGNHHSSTKHSHPHHHSTRPTTPTWFSEGDPPYDANVYDASGAGAKDHPSKARRTIDGNTKTAWTSGDHSGGSAVGIVVDTGQAQPYTKVGIATSTPGFNVSVYSSDNNTGSGDPAANGWKLEGKKSGVAKYQKVGLKGANAQPRYLLIWITKMPSGKSSAGISEISLLL